MIQTLKKINTAPKIINYTQPLVVTSVTDNWAARSKWTPNFFIETYGDRTFPIRDFSNSKFHGDFKNIQMTLKEYFQYWQAIGNEKPEKNLYFANWLFETCTPELMKDFKLPSFLGEDLFHRMPKSLKYDRNWLFFSHPYVDTPAHVDTLYTSAWLTMIEGSKKIRMIAPEHTVHFQNLSNLEDKKELEYCEKNNIPILETIIKPGDFLFMPGGWLHHVTSFEKNILLTGNILDETCITKYFDLILEKAGPRQDIIGLKNNVLAELGVNYGA